MATAGGDSNAGDNDGVGGIGDGGEPGHDSGFGDGPVGRNHGNPGEGTGANPANNIPAPAITANQYLPAAAPIIGVKQMGGTAPSYQTTMPSYQDLKAKHTAGYVNPATKNRSTPNMFNFNGTVYQYEPDQDSYKDLYTGTLITPTNNETGSLGIEGLYGQYEPNAYQQQSNTLQPIANPTHDPVINPEWLAQKAAYDLWKEQKETNRYQYSGIGALDFGDDWHK